MLPQISMECGVVSDPELRFTPAGVAVAKVRVVAKDRKRDAQGQWSDGDPCFLTVTAWRHLAEHICESVVKGSTITVTGRLAQRDWEDKEGQKRTSYEVTADTVGLSLLFATYDRKERVDRPAPPASEGSGWGEPVQADEAPF